MNLLGLILFALHCLLLQLSITRCQSLECGPNEFLCAKEEKCINNEKVCNFVNDCLDGSDESKCGACTFEDSPESCGLRFLPDRIYDWRRQDVMEQAMGVTDEPRHYMSLDLKIQEQKYISTSGSNWHVIYKPMIVFPELRPSTNRECHISIRMLVTDHIAPIIVKKQQQISWPQVFAILVAAKKLDPKNSTYHKSFDLKVSETLASHRGLWHTFMIPVGIQDTVWSLEIILSLHLESYLIHLSEFKFIDCQPSSRDEEIRDVQTELPLYFADPCKSYQFKCELTGKCIDESLVCDYGYDCGTEDPSDETNCSDYPGRCDFEQGNLCDWMPVSGEDIWQVLSAEEGDQLMYRMHRPSVDHTFRSKLAGHYLILDSRKLVVSEMYSLIGPRIGLKEGAQKCSFRFWYHVASTLSSDIVNSPHLSVGHEHIATDQLFKHLNVSHDEVETLEGGFEVYNMGWNRLEVQLLNRYNVDERSIAALELAFGNFDADLQYYIDRGGYLALDDFSFSPGCSLGFYGPRLDQFCEHDQFLCLNKTAVTGVRCIPLENYCDFKNDCGLLKSSDELASDETDCPHECKFLRNQPCAIKVMDARNKRILNELTEEQMVNEAFTWNMTGGGSVVDPPGSLTVSSNSANFIERYMRALENSATSRGLVELDTLEIRLPTFTVSHSNCTFTVNYQWVNGGNNMKAEFRLVTEANGHRNLVKTVRNDQNVMKPEILNIGLGHQRSPFSLVIAVSHLQEVENLRILNESLIIHGYEFSSCSFLPGVIVPPDNEVQFFNDEDGYGAGEKALFDLDYLDYEYAVEVSLKCSIGEFQCKVPILCISDVFVCDMQQDCQGGADEKVCEAWHRYDLEYMLQPLKQGTKEWVVGDQSSISWSLENGISLARRRNDSGPPFDHTRSDYMGGYFMAGGKKGEPDRVSNLHSPVFEQGINSSSNCRAVFYQYSWGKDVNTLRVLKQGFPSGKARSIYESHGPLADRWLMRWLKLDSPNAEPDDDAFSLVFQFEGANSEADVIAIDDIAFSPGCVRREAGDADRLAAEMIFETDSAHDKELEKYEVETQAPDLKQPKQHSLLGTSLVAVIFFLTIGLAVLGYAGFLGFKRVTSVLERLPNRQASSADSGTTQYALESLDRVHLWNRSSLDDALQ